MTTIPRTTRARGGRVLVVGAAANDGTQWAERLATPPACASNAFEAIGQLADHTTSSIVTVVLSTELPALRRVAEAIKRVDPSVKVVQLVTDLATATRGPGVDAIIGVDDEASLLAALDVPLAPPAAPRTSPPRDPEPPPPTLASTTPRDAVTRAVVPAPAATRPLGDIDLVNALLADDDSFRASALALIRQHTGWDDLVWMETSPPDDPDATLLSIDGEVVGALVSARAPADRRAEWARWLEPWLHLESTYTERGWMAFHDDLTGSWNRRYFTKYLNDAIEEAHPRRHPVTVMVFDLDDFKHYNDTYGHEAGDVILQQTVGLLESVIRDTDRVCRIGGDEFAVIFNDPDGPRESGSSHPATVEKMARRFQSQVAAMHFPKLGLEAPGTLSISAGLATFPWDGHDAATLLRQADERALESKRRGKNDLTLGPGAPRDAS